MKKRSFTGTPELRAAPAVEALGEYRLAPLPAPVDLRLDRNEGPPPDAETLNLPSARDAKALRRYPDAKPLEAMVAKELGIEPARVLVTGGSVSAIDRACRAVLHPGKSAVCTKPTFEMVSRCVRLTGAALRAVYWMSGAFPTDEFIAAATPDTTLAVVVSPNNPTGTAGLLEDLEAIRRRIPSALLLVDLAYVEFADHDITRQVLAMERTVALRTYSKAKGLAGLRVGYAAGCPRAIGWMRAVGGPYEVSGPALRVAEHAVQRGDTPAQREYIARVREERGELARTLNNLGAKAIPSQANFVLARFPDGRLARDGLSGLGIAVREFPGTPHLENRLRITCPGNAADFQRLTRALRNLLRPEALLVDLDGVLCDPRVSFRRTIIETAKSFGVEIAEEEIQRAKAAGGANNDWTLTHRLLSERGADVSPADVTSAFRARYNGTPGTPGLNEAERLIVPLEVLGNLAGRIPLALVTGRARDDAESFLRRMDIASLFATVVTMDDAPEKPDPAPLRLAMKRLDARHAWMLGDNPDDMRAARDAGVLPVGVLGPGETDGPMREALFAAGAGWVLDNLAKLPDRMDALGAAPMEHSRKDRP